MSQPLTETETRALDFFRGPITCLDEIQFASLFQQETLASKELLDHLVERGLIEFGQDGYRLREPSTS